MITDCVPQATSRVVFGTQSAIIPWSERDDGQFSAHCAGEVLDVFEV